MSTDYIVESMDIGIDYESEPVSTGYVRDTARTSLFGSDRIVKVNEYFTQPIIVSVRLRGNKFVGFRLQPDEYGVRRPISYSGLGYKVEGYELQRDDNKIAETIRRKLREALTNAEGLEVTTEPMPSSKEEAE